MKKEWLVVVFLLYAFSTGSYASLIFQEDFSTLPTITTTKTARFSGAAATLDGDPYVSSPTSLFLDAWGTTSGWAEAYYLWDLGSNYDFYNGGAAEASVQVSRPTTCHTVTVQLLNASQVVVASAAHSFTDFNVWHNLLIDLDGDETAVRYVNFINKRSSGTSASRVNVDDFVVTPEPATVILLLGGAVVAFKKRRCN